MESSVEVLPLPIPMLEVVETREPPNPWKVVTPSKPCLSLSEVMSEQLAQSLQADEERTPPIRRAEAMVSLTEPTDPPYTDEDGTETSSDLLLAQMLQAQFDSEHDHTLELREQKYNRDSKVSVSFKNYRCIPSEFAVSSDESDDDYDESLRPIDSFVEAEKASSAIGRCGFVKQGSVVTTTKHDATICGKKNACRVMMFPPGFETGDAGSFDMRLNNQVYNSLKAHSRTEEKRSKRIHDKIEKATSEAALDPKTRILIFKMINNGILDGVNGVISTGKEAVVLRGTGGSGSPDLPEIPTDCAVKVFKTTLNEFKNREIYIRDDFRFSDRCSKQNPRKFIRQWAEKEMHNLVRVHRAGLPCPEVVLLKKHVLVMSFIGSEQKPAPKLKDVRLTTAQWEMAYHQVLEMTHRLYHECRLVHADLSEYNMLWHDERVWLIDMSQSVEPTHPSALQFLLRDCGNVSKFFDKQGVVDVLSPKAWFTSICGIDLPGEGTELLAQIQDFERNEELIAHGASEKPYPFDYVFHHCQESSLQQPNDRESDSSDEETDGAHHVTKPKVRTAYHKIKKPATKHHHR